MCAQHVYAKILREPEGHLNAYFNWAQCEDKAKIVSEMWWRMEADELSIGIMRVVRSF